MNLLKFIDQLVGLYGVVPFYCVVFRRNPNGCWKKDRVRLWKPLQKIIELTVWMSKSFIHGLRSHIPLCCIIAYCLGKAKGIAIQTNLFDVYRPCLKHYHTVGITDKRHLELLNNGECPLPNFNFDEEGNMNACRRSRSARSV